MTQERKLYRQLLADNNNLKLEDSPLIDILKSMVHEILLPRPDNFTPPERTPWGGYEIEKRYNKRQSNDKNEVVGESWEISGHPSFPNIFTIEYENNTLSIPISILEQIAPEQLYGNGNHSMPILVKLLNSGSWTKERAILKKYMEVYLLDNNQLHILLKKMEKNNDTIKKIHQQMLVKNLSIQVHPQKNNPYKLPSKTEAWYIIDADPGSGIYLGLHDDVTKEQFTAAMHNGDDVSQLLNFVPVHPGDTYFIPAGTLHAIGAGILLLEIQETSETTFRAYDWDRLTNGKPRQLHFNEVTTVTDWKGLRGEELVNSLQRLPQNTTEIIKSDEFQLQHITLDEKNNRYISEKDHPFNGITVIQGTVEISNNYSSHEITAGHSAIIPFAASQYFIVSKTPNSTFLLLS